MKNLQIFLLLNGTTLLQSDYIYIHKAGKDSVLIRLDTIRLEHPITLRKNNELILEIPYKEYNSGFRFTLLEDATPKNGESIWLLSDNAGDDYWQNEIDIFSAWDNHLLIHWSHLSVEMQWAWIRACFAHSGLAKSVKPEQNYIIDGNLVKTMAGFYCLLGEVFFGEKGYFGGCLDSLEDCMIEFYHTHPPYKCHVIFKNKDRLKKVLSKRAPDYLDIVISLFQRYGFTVIQE